MDIEAARLDAVARLEVLRRKLEDEGRYVGANTCSVALERLTDLHNFIETVELYFREETLCRPLGKIETALSKAAKLLLSGQGQSLADTLLPPPQ